MRGDSNVIDDKTCPLYEFDELLEGTQEDVVAFFLANDPTCREQAIRDLKHMKFNANGKILNEPNRKR